MLKPIPWANSIAIISVVFYLALWILAVMAPPIFKFVFNAQFFGADIASLYPGQNMQTGAVTLIIIAVSTWVVGYIWATLYNKLSK